MAQLYKTIGLIGKPHHAGASATIEALHQYLLEHNYQVVVERSVAQSINLQSIEIKSLTEIGEQADLAIVVGGDGYMLGAAREPYPHPCRYLRLRSLPASYRATPHQPP